MTTTRTRTRRATADDGSPDPSADTATRWVRTPTSLLHLVVGVAILTVGTLLAWRFANAAAAVNADGRALTRGLPSWLRLLPVVLVGSVLVLVPLVVNVVLLARRRFRLWAVVNLAAVSAALLSGALVGLVTRVPPERFPRAYLVDGTRTSPNEALLAAAMAAFVVGLPWLRAGQRRLVYAGLALHLAVNMVFGDLPTVSWLVDVGMGVTCGAVVALAFGTPDRRPGPRLLADALARSGVPMAELLPASVDARGSTPWFGTTTDGRRLFVKVLDRDNRSADLLFRLVRFVRLRHTGDEAPFSSLRRAVEHEALLSLRAGSVGIPTPELVAVSEVGGHGMLLAYAAIGGASFDQVDDDALTDDVLDGIWGLVAQLRHAGIAHRDLRLANLFLADDGEPLLIDFGFAELAASDLLLATDVAELLASTAPRVGVVRAVDAAERALGPDVLAQALPRVQPLALGSATRTALRDQHLLDPLREEVRTRCGLDEVAYEEIARVNGRTVAVVLALAVGLWVLLSQLADADGIWRTLRDARWPLAAGVVAAAMATFVATAVALRGTVRERVPLWPMVEAELASAYSDATTPATLGGAPVRVRFLQKQGVESGEAATAVAVDTVAGLLAGGALLFLSLGVARRYGVISLSVPPVVLVLAVAAGAVALATLLWAVPAGRRVVSRTVVVGLRRPLSAMREVAVHPGRLAELVGGQLLGTLLPATALVLSVRTMGGDTAVSALVVVYLVGAIATAVAPTPGGLGVAEAVLVVGLRLVGEPAAIAVPAVFLFRSAAFWLPVVPGLWAARRLERAGEL